MSLIDPNKNPTGLDRRLADEKDPARRRMHTVRSTLEADRIAVVPLTLPPLAASLLGVEGILEREGEVTHLIAEHLTDYSTLIGNLDVHSRDFH